jgi:arylsulfatase A-like enzyme
VSLAPPGYRADETQTAFLVEKLLEWHGEQGDDPWFAHISFLRPHPPFVVPEPYASMVRPEDVPPPIAVSDDPHVLVRLTRELTSASNFQPGLEGSVAQLSPGDMLRIRALYYGMIAEVDTQLGRLFETRSRLAATGTTRWSSSPPTTARCWAITGCSARAGFMRRASTSP